MSVDGWAGGNGDWSNAANWYEGTPGPTTRWEITTPGVTVTLAAGESYSAGAGTVVAGAGLDVAGTLATSGALTVDGVVVNSGTLDPTVSVAAGGYLNNQAGAQIVGNTGAYAQNGGPGVYLAAGGTLVNAGAITGGRR